MSDNVSENMNNELFEALLQQAVKQDFLNEISKIPPDEDLARLYTFSDEHNKKMKKLFSADNRKQVLIITLKWTKVAVVTVCVSASLLFGTLMSSAEFRKAVSDVIITWYERFTKFQSPEVNEDYTDRKWTPSYLPGDFELFDAYEVGDIKGIEYVSPSGGIVDFTYRPSDVSTSVDNEDMEYSTVVENDIIYHIFKTTSERKDSKIVWDMNGYRFTVTGSCEVDELVKIALSVE